MIQVISLVFFFLLLLLLFFCLCVSELLCYVMLCYVLCVCCFRLQREDGRFFFLGIVDWEVSTKVEIHLNMLIRILMLNIKGNLHIRDNLLHIPHFRPVALKRQSFHELTWRVCWSQIGIIQYRQVILLNNNIL